MLNKRKYDGYGPTNVRKWFGSRIGGFSPRVASYALKAGQQAIHQGMRMLGAGSHSRTLTYAQRRRRGQFTLGQTSYGRLSGKVTARRGARSYKRRGRRSRRRAVVKRLFKGVSYQTEYANTTTGDKCVYVGHTTALPDEMLTLLILSAFKNVMIEFGVSINSWSQARAGYISNGDVLQFVYKATPVSAPASVGSTITVVAGNLTFWDVAASLFGAVKATMTAGGFGDASILTEMQFIPSGGRLVKVDLQDAMIDMYFKSALKVQNRSVASVGDDEVDVNNVPVYGKLYNGTGNGMLQRTVDNIQFLNGASTSINVTVDASLFNNFAEPPAPSEFTHCTRYSKVYLNPGQIKTSLLNFKTKINVTNLWIKLFHYYASNATNEWFSLGCFNIFGVERVIAKLAAEASPGITLTWEIDNKCYGTLSPSPQKFTSPYRAVL